MEKTRLRNQEIRYIVKFEDDRAETILITNGMILTGEHPVSIAERRQAKGELPPGRITLVTPDKSMRPQADAEELKGRRRWFNTEP
jgi:hypothetical protein